MKDIDIESLNIRVKSEMLVADYRSARSAYRKIPVDSEFINLGMTGFEGDMVYDKKHHGGNDKAICCYSADHFQYWKHTVGLDLKAAAFGENLTLSGDSSLESSVYIGDRYVLGEAIVEVSEPRGPCYMIGIRYNIQEFPVFLQKTGYTGFYLRTIKPGMVKLTDRLIHLSSHPERISVMDVNTVRYHDRRNKGLLTKLAGLDELTLDWRERFSKMLAKL